MSDAEKRGLSDQDLAAQNAKETGVENLREPFSVQGVVQNLAMGGVMAGFMGPTIPHAVVEAHDNIMTRTQQLMAQRVKAEGGDDLSAVGAAAQVNAELSAHHDAAAYETHMQNAEMENAARRQENFEAAEAAAKEENPQLGKAAAFANREQQQQATRDQAFPGARNQVGEPALQHGETSAMGAEKGEEGFNAPTLADTLPPEQQEAMRTLAQRRAEEPGEPPEEPQAPMKRPQGKWALKRLPPRQAPRRAPGSHSGDGGAGQGPQTLAQRRQERQAAMRQRNEMAFRDTSPEGTTAFD